jgi:hypothetical protein
METYYTTSTLNAEITYVFDEMVTVTVAGVQMTLPRRVLVAMIAVGQGLMLDQMQKDSS